MYVASFGAAQYKCTDKRTAKPFNPILGETFELAHPDYKYFAEQVSHHPPVSAVHAESNHYIYTCDTNAKMSFNGTYLKAIPIGF
jgi:oxysterol-binding protein 1